MTELQKLIKLLKKYKIKYDTFDDEIYFTLKAMKKNAKTCVWVLKEVDFYFDKKGKFIGHVTSSVNSFVRRK